MISSPRFRARRATTAAIISLAAPALLGGVAHAGSPQADAAKRTYSSLKAAGLTVQSASLKSRTLRVKVTATKPLALRFAIVRGTKQLGSAKISVRKGTTSLKLLLNQKSTGRNLRLRVTARSGNKRGRQRVGVGLIALPKPDTGGQGTPVPTPTPTPTPVPPAPNRAPTALALTGSGVAENAPAGSTVGNLQGTDPDPGDTLTYAFANGTGDTDNASFALSDGTLRTAASFDFEAKNSYSVRLLVADGRGGTFAQAFAVSVANANEAPSAITISSTSVAENQPVGTPVGTLGAADPDASDSAGFTLVPGTGDSDNASFAIVGGELRSAAVFDRETKSSYTVRVRATDGGGLSFERAIAITVGDVNDAPAVTTTGGPLAYLENDPATPVDAAAVASDVDSPIASGTVQLTTGYASAEDVLAYTAPAGNPVTGSYDAGTGTMTLTGPATPAQFTAALQAVTYRNTSSNPSTAQRTATFLVSDGALSSPAATRDITVASGDDPPDVDTSAGALAYTENGPASAIDTTIAITDVDSTDLTGASVSVTGNHVPGEDVLGLPAQPGISSAYDGATGTLTLSGTATVAAYEAALEAVTYVNISDAPSTLTRTVTYQARDAGGFGAADTHGVTVSAVDDAPVAVDDAATVAEDSGAAAVTVLANDTDVDAGPRTIQAVTQPANGAVVITGGGTGLTYAPDANSCNSPPGTTPDTFTYTLTPGGSSATVSMTVTCVDDVPVAVNDSATVAEDSGATAVTVLANDTDIDGGPIAVSSVTQPANGTVSNNGSDVSYTPDADYCNSPPGTTPDTFTYTLAPGGSSATVAVDVTCADDPPVAVNDAATVAEDSAANAVDVLVNDTDADGGPKVVLSVTQPANGSAVITGGGSGVSYTPDASVCNTPPGTTPDTFTYTLNGGSTATVSVTVTCADDAPVVDTSAGAAGYTENAAPLPIDPGLTVTDPDAGGTITGATVEITANYAGAQDVLALGGVHPLITAGQVGNTLTLTGTATPAAYQAALRAVTYVNSSEGPSTLARTVTFTVTDDTALSGSATRGLTVAAVNDAPSAIDDTGTTDEDTVLNVAAPGVLGNDTDVDPGDTKTAVALNGTGTLTQTLPSGASVTINANGSYTYDPLDAFQGLSTGQNANDSFTYTMQDAAGAQDTATVSLLINGVSDAPTAVADSFDAIGNTGLFMGTARPATQAGRERTGSVLTNDTDPDTPQASLVVEPVTDAPTTLGGTITIEADGNFTYHPDDGDTGVTDTFTYRVCDASPCNSGTVANATGTLSLPIAGQVWYVRNTEPAGGDGTSDAPFDTLAEAEAASGTGDTTYVFDGSNTTTNLDTGYAMNASERLIGESRPLSLDPDGAGPLPTAALFPGTSGFQPTLTATDEDVIVLASNVVVDGVDVDPTGTGGGLFGGTGTNTVTVANANVTDTGTAGTQPGIELDGTTGVNRFTAVTVTNGGSATAIGVRINNADRVFFVDTATNTISTTGAKALDVASTNLFTSRWNDITVTGSGTGAIRLNGVSGLPQLGDGAGTDLMLQTTSGATAALDIASSNTVTVDSAGTDTISATGGPALDIRSSNSSTFTFDSASSTNSAGDGVNLDLNASTAVTIATGAISGAAGIAFDLNGIGGNVEYGGAINDGSGASAEITGRSGGSVTLSGTIADGADAGGGITVAGNSGGSVTFSGTTKTMSTGASPAVVVTSNGAGATTAFTGGGLDIDATSASGLEASSNSGTLEVSGAGNSIATTTGRALNVLNTPISANDLTFRSIAANGAPNGIVLNATGTAGGLTVTGDGAAGTGGTIQSTTGDAISLTSTQDVSLSHMAVLNNLGNGVRGSTVTNFTLQDSSVDNNGNDAATDEAGLHFTNLAGTANILRTLVANSPEDNARIVNASVTLSQLNVTDSIFRDTDTLSPGNNGLLIQADGGSITADLLGNQFLRNRANGLQVITNGTGSMNVEVDDSGATQSSFDDNNIGVNVAHNSSGSFRYDLRDLTIDGLNVTPGTGGSASPININRGSVATTDMVGTVTGNTLTNSNSTTGPGIRMIGNGAGTMTSLIQGNTISQIANRGIEVIARDGSNRINATVANNSVTLNNALSGDAIRVDSGAISSDTTTICADIRGNTATTAAVGLFGVKVRQRFSGPGTSFILEDYAGSATDDAAVQNFLSTGNNAATTSADHAGTGFTTIADCPTPP